MNRIGMLNDDVIRIVNSAHEKRLAKAEENRWIRQQAVTRTLTSMVLLGIVCGVAGTGLILGIGRLLKGFTVDDIAHWFIPSLIVLSMAAGGIAYKYVFCRYELL